MENYNIVKELGKGAFGSVVQAYDKLNKRQVAIKMFIGKELSAQKEIKIHKFLLTKKSQCTNIVNYYDSFRFDNQWWVVMELLGTNLKNLFEKNYIFKLEHLKIITKSVLAGLRYLHEHRFVHADLKMDNIAINNPETMECKIIDLGNCIFMKDLPKDQKTYESIQHQLFRAPEVFIKAPLDEKIDIFSVGLILALLSNKKYLFEEWIDHRQLMKMVEYLGFPPRDIIEKSFDGQIFFNVGPSSVSFGPFPGSKNLIAKSKNLKDLCVIRDIKFIDFLEKCLDMDPSKRGSAKHLQTHPWLAVPN